MKLIRIFWKRSNWNRNVIRNGNDLLRTFRNCLVTSNSFYTKTKKNEKIFKKFCLLQYNFFHSINFRFKSEWKQATLAFPVSTTPDFRQTHRQTDITVSHFQFLHCSFLRVWQAPRPQTSNEQQDKQKSDPSFQLMEWIETKWLEIYQKWVTGSTH